MVGTRSVVDAARTRSPRARRWGASAAGPIDSPSGLLERLEPRLVLATFNTVDFFPLPTSATWNYSGTVDINSTHATGATGLMTSTGNQVQAGATFTDLSLAVSGGSQTTGVVFRAGFTPLGLRFGLEKLTVDGNTAENEFGVGYRFLPPTIDEGVAYGYGRSFSGMDTPGATWTGFASGNVQVGTAASITVPAGTFTAIKVERQGTFNLSGNRQGGGAAFTASGTRDESMWLVMGVGIVKYSLSINESFSDAPTLDYATDLDLTGATLLNGTGNAQVTGRNGLVIANQDSTPTFTDGTGFSSVDVNGQTRDRVFTITNTGPGTLNILSISLGGIAPSQFSVLQPATTALATGESTTFTLTFDPSSVGNKRARVNISTDAQAQGTFFYSVRGDGVANGALSLRSGPSNGAIDDRSTVTARENGTRFGFVDSSSGTFTRIYKLTNTGLGDLSLTGSPLVTISGRNASMFSVTQFPSTPVAPGQTVTFKITFDPSSAGFKRATVSFATSDWRFPTFTFDVTGSGV